MKILKDNYAKSTNETEVKFEPYPRKLTCENCGSELEYEESDLRIGALGCVYLDCPLCGNDNMLEENEKAITLTRDNIEFPTHFFHTSAKVKAVDVCNNERIKQEIHRGIDYLRKHKDEFAWLMQTGNLYVAIYRYDGTDKEYEVIISNDYYDTYIPFESQDY